MHRYVYDMSSWSLQLNRSYEAAAHCILDKSTGNAVEPSSFILCNVLQDLEDKKTELDERGSNISDSSPVVRIKAAIKSIKVELQQMSVRTGVLQHQLLQVMLAKSRDRLTADVASS